VPHPEPPVQSTVDISSRLEEFGLGDKSEEKFGKSEYTADLAFHGGPHYVILAAIPLDKVAHSSTHVLRIAKTMLNRENWWDNSGSKQEHPPKYWPFSIFEVPISRHSYRNAFIWEDPGNQGESVLSRLVITGLAEVLFVSAYAFVTALDSRKGERILIFELGPILAECWKLSGLVAQLYQEIEYSGRTQLCVGMVNTKGSHLGGFATPWAEPDSPRYWHDVWLLEPDWSCHSLHLRFCETANLLEMEPKKQPEFIREFGEAISLAYNHDEPHCFEKETGLIPSRYFKRGSF
jgi:hypothetical protein